MKTQSAIVILFILLTACSNDEQEKSTVTLNYTFETGDEGWIAGYSDYPAGITTEDSLELYEMSFGHSVLPSSITPEQYGIRISGHNRSDDLFMYIKKKVTGLEPNTVYNISFSVELASNAPTNAVGIGGPPGEAVTLKAGAVTTEPRNITDDLNWYRLNLDKGNQSTGGNDVVILGHIGVDDNTTSYTLITRSAPSPLLKKADATGGLWIFVGTESGFEGFTELYYSEISVVLKEQ